MIHFTPTATKVLQDHLPESPNVGFRLLIRKSCSSIHYTLRHESNVKPTDELVEINDDIKLFIDAETFPLVDNTKVDFIEDHAKSGFTFDNPNIVMPSCSDCESSCQEAS